jgi:transposase-like protein
MSRTPLIAQVPLTTKVPEACPHCGGRNPTRRGIRKKKPEIVQLWRCASCKRTFTPGPAALRNKTYPLRTILSALSDYDLGYPLEKTAKRLRRKSGHNVSLSTIAAWLEQYKQYCSYRRLRAKALRRFTPQQTVRSVKLYHRQVYGYAFHRPKLEFLRAGMLDDKRSGNSHLASVADFLEAIPTTCPHDLFRREDQPEARVSQTHPEFVDISRVVVNRKRNAATDAAALIIQSVGNNKLRHDTFQRFMLANDSVTVAIEIPIWLREHDIGALEWQLNVELASRANGVPRVITGHIDFLQVRNGAVHILDYEPDASTNKPIAQLTIYALALTRLVQGLRLFDIKCAWFNEQEYCEFFPRTLFLKR